jgi:hypothetical protein
MTFPPIRPSAAALRYMRMPWCQRAHSPHEICLANVSPLAATLTGTV